MFTLSTGQAFADEVVLNKERIGFFGHASGDMQPIHFDPDFAQRCGFDTVIGHGVLSLGFISSLLGMNVVPKELRNDWIIVLGEIGPVRFCNPAHPGDRIRTSALVVEVKPNGWCVLAVQIHNLTWDKPIIKETTVTIRAQQIT
jgi:acyl dehydratase